MINESDLDAVWEYGLHRIFHIPFDLLFIISCQKLWRRIRHGFQEEGEMMLMLDDDDIFGCYSSWRLNDNIYICQSRKKDVEMRGKR